MPCGTTVRITMCTVLVPSGAKQCRSQCMALCTKLIDCGTLLSGERTATTHDYLLFGHLILEGFPLPSDVVHHAGIAWLIEDVEVLPRPFHGGTSSRRYFRHRWWDGVVAPRSTVTCNCCSYHSVSVLLIQD